MLQRTREIWDEQDRHRGDRLRLFTAVSDALTPTSALYPGSFADIAPSFLIDDVTYVDSDRRARQFFADDASVDQLIAEHRRPRATTAHWRFIHGDYRRALPVADAHVDLLISLYAGPVSQHCTRYPRSGGFLLVTPATVMPGWRRWTTATCWRRSSRREPASTGSAATISIRI